MRGRLGGAESRHLSFAHRNVGVHPARRSSGRAIPPSFVGDSTAALPDTLQS